MFFVLDENNNKVEAFDKQGVLNAIETAIKDGSLENLVADAAFIEKIKCCVGGGTHKFAFVTQAKYNELVENDLVQPNTYYIITDDTTAEGIDEALTALDGAMKAVEDRATSLEDRAYNLEDRAYNLEDRASNLEDRATSLEDGTKKAGNAANAEKINGIEITEDSTSGVIKLYDSADDNLMRRKVIKKNVSILVGNTKNDVNILTDIKSVYNRTFEIVLGTGHIFTIRTGGVKGKLSFVFSVFSQSGEYADFVNLHDFVVEFDDKKLIANFYYLAPNSVSLGDYERDTAKEGVYVTGINEII